MFKKLGRKKVIIIVMIIVLLIAAAVAAYFVFSENPSIKNIFPIKKVYYCPICGEKVKESDLNKKPLAIMIENMKIVRPQFGLSRACMVFEALAEGGITRFCAVYGGHRHAKTIGPVRSARPYYVVLARGFDPIYAHAGGSKKGLEMIKETGIDSFDQFAHESGYWRDYSKRAPHNLYTSTEKLREGASKEYDMDADFDGFEFYEKKVKRGKKKKVIGIEFSLQSYYVSYEYNPQTNTYDRYNDHILQRDATDNRTISPSNVIIVIATTSEDLDDTLDIDVEGKGPATFFVGGKVIEGEWVKDDASSQIEFYDIEEKEVKLNPGQTWVEVVRTDTKVTY